MLLPADCYLVEVDFILFLNLGGGGGGIQVVFGVFYRHIIFFQKNQKNCQIFVRFKK
jgi:hypothetical protein